MKFNFIKNIFILSWLLASFAQGEDFRMWTEAGSKRKIEACIIDKALDDGGARLARRNGTTFWIEADQLVEADRKYIKNWIKRMKHISAEIIAFGKGKKTVKVEVQSGTRDLVIKAYYTDKKKKQPKGYPKIYKVKKGETMEFTYTGSNHYIVKAFHNKKEIEAESWRKKTGGLNL